MEDNNKIRVGITHGDINGVGYEVILKTFADPTMLELCTPIIYGSPKVAAYHRKAMDIQANFSIINSADDAMPDRLSILNCTEDELKVELSKPTTEAGKAALDALERALQDYKYGLIDVLVTAPINKNTIQSEAFHFPGHTEYIEERVGEGQKALMILRKYNLRSSVLDARANSRSWNSFFSILKGLGIDMRFNHAENSDKICGISFCQDEYSMAGSKLDRDLSFNSLCATLGNVAAELIIQPHQAIIPSGGGGGTNNEQGWRNDKDKDNQRNEPFYKTSKRRR